MPSLAEHLDRLAAATHWTYRASAQSCSEPAAWAALALTAHGRTDDAARPAKWLAALQQREGSIGISESESEPRWPTSLAIWAWASLDAARHERRFVANIEQAVAWSLAHHGKASPRSPQIGHNTELVGWSWAAETHSWLEPTAFFVLGLRMSGRGDHPRVREGIRLLVDRLLPDGGANYGNTIVLGQPLLPHVQPTGIAMVALAGERVGDPRMEKSLDYLHRSLNSEMAPASLSFACLGVSAHRGRIAAANEWLLTALDDATRGPLAEYERALLLLSAAPVERLHQITAGAAV
jgi:hypothetical protein